MKLGIETPSPMHQDFQEFQGFARPAPRSVRYVDTSNWPDDGLDELLEGGRMLLAGKPPTPSAPPSASAYDVQPIDHGPAHRRNIAVLVCLMLVSGLVAIVGACHHQPAREQLEAEAQAADVRLDECMLHVRDCAGVLRCAPDVACVEMSAEVARREGVLP
jgi:hypothetical protein